MQSSFYYTSNINLFATNVNLLFLSDYMSCLRTLGPHRDNTYVLDKVVPDAFI